MKAVITKIKDKTQSAYDIQTFHYLSEQKAIVFALTGGYLKSIPEKTLYDVVVLDDKGKEVQSYTNVLFNQYNFMLDQRPDTNGVTVPTVVNNSISFNEV
jgi:hypothetical protein